MQWLQLDNRTVTADLWSSESGLKLRVVKMGSEKFCLRWNDFETNISSAFRDLREDKDFFDVTIACDDEQIQAHKVILSACSPFFHKILHKNPHPHPLLYLKGVKYIDIQAVLNFMYHGEVNVAQEELNTFLAVAEDLRVKGLTQNQAEPKTNTLYATKSQVQPRASEKAQASPVPLKRPKTTPTISSSPLLDDHDIVEFVPVKSEPKDPLPHVTVQPDDIYSPPSSHPAPRAISTQDDQDMAFQETQGFEDYGQYAEDQGYPGVEDTGGDDNKGQNNYFTAK